MQINKIIHTFSKCSVWINIRNVIQENACNIAAQNKWPNSRLVKAIKNEKPNKITGNIVYREDELWL